MENKQIKVINLKTSASCLKWNSVIDTFGFKDGFVSAEYASISKDYFGNEPILFVYAEGKNRIAYFFIKRTINDLPFIPKEMAGNHYFDIISPEYGGPIIEISECADKEKLIKNFFDEFEIFCKSNNIVTEFCRLNPFNPILDAIIHLRGARKNRDTVYIDLSKEKTEIWQNFRKGARSSVNKATRSGVVIKQEKSEECIEKMYEIYTSTMQRRKALGEYFFKKKYFEMLVCRLKDKIDLYTAWYDDKIISSSLFLSYGNICHYFFSGTNEEYFNVCPANLILNEAIFTAKEKGFKIFHLGGGYQPNDSLFDFKTSFSKNTAAFYTYDKIYDKSVYEALCKAKKDYDKTNGKENLRPGYFPEYRS